MQTKPHVVFSVRKGYVSYWAGNNQGSEPRKQGESVEQTIGRLRKALADQGITNYTEEILGEKK